jgi:hypothetical protein
LAEICCIVFAGAVFVFAGILIAELLGPPAAPESPEPTIEIA